MNINASKLEGRLPLQLLWNMAMDQAAKESSRRY